MSGGWPHFLDQLCEPVWGLKAEHLAVMWKLRARGWMVALKGQTASREKCCKKQTKHNGKENLTEHNRSVSGGTLTWRTRWHKPKDQNTLKRLKVHQYKSQWWFMKYCRHTFTVSMLASPQKRFRCVFFPTYVFVIYSSSACFCSLFRRLTPQDHRRIENTH